jgi:F-type H+-transporting ATPase subunit alpha
MSDTPPDPTPKVPEPGPSPTPEPTPAPTPEPASEPTPAPTPEPEPTPAPEPAPTPEPASEPAPDAAPAADQQDHEEAPMSALTIDTASIAAALRKNLEGFTVDVSVNQVGRVLEVGDGIARVAGLPDASVNELLEFEDGTLGLALNLDEDSIGAVILGEGSHVEEGQTVKATGRILSVPVGDSLLGRVVDALGNPIDGKGAITGAEQRRMEIQAPGITGRKPVHEPLQTGIKSIDAMTPIGRGQRQLIIGDRKTGKTTIAVDTIINQRGLGVKCIYVAIGQKGSTVANTVATLEEYGAMEYTVVVSAPASDPAPFKYLAPYGGCAMGQHWMENGEHALIVYDDLSKQAEAYRQLSLLLRRPPGREAYPGDVFYLHSRLLERAAKLSDDRGAGSLTALPVIETKGGDVSAYIPTNVISITDGQVYLQDDLFKSGVRPAVDVGISVSRVGGAAQIKAMKKVVGTLKTDLAQFRELEAFATFGSELDAISKAQLERGTRLVELLKQPLNSPMPVEEQVVALAAGTRGALDKIPAEDVGRFETHLLETFRSQHRGILDKIRDEGTVPDELDDALASTVESFEAEAPDTPAAPAADPTATDAEGVDDAASAKTLATE